MPTYEYKCEECGMVFERFQHFSEEPVKTCPECDGPVRRVIHPVGIIFRGKGFYVTDNRGNTPSLMPKSGSGEEKAASKADSSDSDKTSEPAKASDSSSKKDD